MKNINIELTYVELTRIILSLEKSIEKMESRGVDPDYPNSILEEYKVLLEKLRIVKKAETKNILGGE